MVEVVIPYRDGCRYRARALAWVLARYRERHPAWRVTVAEHPAGPWVKAAAVMPAVRGSRADVLIVADGDVWCDAIAPAVAAVQDGAAWAVPHRLVRRLTDQATALTIAGSPWERLTLAERPYTGREGGGLVVASRDTMREVPMDERFVGWGREDQAWAMALTTLRGPCWRGHAPLVHLWHPPQPRPDRKRGRPETEALFRAYCRARRSPARMRALLDGASPCRSTICSTAPAR